MLGPRRRSRIVARPRRLRRWASRNKPWFVVVPAVIVLVVVIPLAWIPPPESVPDWRGFSESVDRSLLTGAMLALAAFIWFNFWITRRATRELLQVAQQSPEQMFPYAPEAGLAKHVFGRKPLVRDIANGLRAGGAGPQIVVGSTGSGKTTLLLALASYFAKEHRMVPIVLSLRDKDNDLEKEDFTELAMKRFRELVDPYIKADAEADKLWRSLCRGGRIAILADDLDRSFQVNDGDPYRTRIRLALGTARRRNLPLIVATRPSGLPPNLSEVPIDLAAIRLDGEVPSAARYVLGRAGEVDEKALRRVERNIRKGHLLENAFYLGLLVQLLRIGVLEEPARGGRHAVRLGLLEADRKRLCGEDVLSEEEWKRRDRMLRGIEKLAAAWLVPPDTEGFDPCWQSAVRDGEQLGLLSLDDRRRPQFKHEVLHAFYASRAIAAGASWKSKLNQRPNGARVQLTLVLTAARGEQENFCREACDRLLAEAEELNPDQRLLRAAGAAELVRAGSFDEKDEEIADAFLRLRAEAGPLAKRTALGQLKRLGGKHAVEALWTYAQDDVYSTRWAAVKCLVQRCSDRPRGSDGGIRPPFGAAAYEVIEPMIEAGLAAARPLVEPPQPEPVDDWDRRIIVLKQLAWMLPSLRTAAKDRGLYERIDAQLKELLRLQCEGVTFQRGLEASIAQGFKVDARRNPEKPPDREAETMLRKGAVFWYSQLNLVHALALRMAMDANSTRGSLASIVTAVEQRERERKRGWSEGTAVTADLHPMLRYAAQLCMDALRGKPGEERLAQMKRVVWKDEGVVVSRRPRSLDRAAAQLVGDITVVLNLNETGSAAQRRAFGEDPTLPHCLRKSFRRREFREGCHDDCGFQLCPFQPASGQPSAHRELSRAFCRDQRRRASGWRARRWATPMTPRALPAFWRWLEAQARF